MVTKVHESFDAGQFLTGNLNHFTVSHADLLAAATAEDRHAAMKHLVETAGTRATVVVLGTAVDNGLVGDIRIAVENNESWTAAGLEAALGAADWDVADFAY